MGGGAVIDVLTTPSIPSIGLPQRASGGQTSAPTEATIDTPATSSPQNSSDSVELSTARTKPPLPTTPNAVNGFERASEMARAVSRAFQTLASLNNSAEDAGTGSLVLPEIPLGAVDLLTDNQQTPTTGLAGTGATDEDGELATSGDGKLDMMMRLVESLDEELGEKGRAQLEKLKEFQSAMSRALETTEQTASLQTLSTSATSEQSAAPRVFVFELYVERTVNVEAAVAELNEQGFSAAVVSYEESSSFHLRIEVGERTDPIVLDLNGNGEIDLSTPTAKNEGGELFDINADGKLDRTAFVAQGDGFLAMDRNGNGTIDDGSELFGDHHGATNGMEELRKFDENRDDVVDSRDSAYERLVAFYDINLDGKIKQTEFVPISQLGINSIGLDYRAGLTERADGNAISATSFAQTAQGPMLVADAELITNPATPTA